MLGGIQAGPRQLEPNIPGTAIAFVYKGSFRDNDRIKRESAATISGLKMDSIADAIREEGSPRLIEPHTGNASINVRVDNSNPEEMFLAVHPTRVLFQRESRQRFTSDFIFVARAEASEAYCADSEAMIAEDLARSLAASARVKSDNVDDDNFVIVVGVVGGDDNVVSDDEVVVAAGVAGVCGEAKSTADGGRVFVDTKSTDGVVDVVNPIFDKIDDKTSSSPTFAALTTTSVMACSDKSCNCAAAFASDSAQ